MLQSDSYALFFNFNKPPCINGLLSLVLAKLLFQRRNPVNAQNRYRRIIQLKDLKPSRVASLKRSGEIKVDNCYSSIFKFLMSKYHLIVASEQQIQLLNQYNCSSSTTKCQFWSFFDIFVCLREVSRERRNILNV